MSNPIFQTQFQLWSLKDSVSWSLATNYWAEFKQTWKGLAMEFDYLLNNYILIDNIFSFKSLAKFTFTLSFNPNKLINNNWILMYDTYNWQTYKVWLRINMNNKLVFWCRDGEPWTWFELITTNTLTTEAYFVVCSFDSETDNHSMSLYNGNWLVESLSSTTAIWVISSVDALIKLGSNAIYWFDWYIYDYNKFNNVLSQSEINNLYKEFLARKPLTTATTHFTYHKPSRLSEDGLVFASNMIPSEWGVLTDISGNWNNGVINWPLATLDWLAFDGVDDYCYFPSSGFNHLEFSVCTVIKTTDTVGDLFRKRSGGSKGWVLLLLTNGFRFILDDDIGGFVDTSRTGAPINNNTFISVCLTVSQTSGEAKIYVDGVKLSTTINISSVAGDFRNTEDFKFFGDTVPLIGESSSLKYYNKILSLDEIKDYHNKRASQIYLAEDFRYAPADETNVLPLGWIPWTGSYKIVENAWLDGNSKALENVSDGGIEKQSSLAYWTFEFEIMQSVSNTGVTSVFIIKDGADSYIMQMYNTWLRFLRWNWSTSSSEMFTDLWYVTKGVVYGIKITRTISWNFTAYIRGWIFGNNYELISTLWGTWTNPTIDNTLTESKSLTFAGKPWDQVSNILYTKWIIV